MNPFLREKADGRRTAGYLTYLLGGAGTIAAIAFLHHRAGESGHPAARGHSRGADIRPITQPAALMSPVRVEAKIARAEIKSYRLDSSKGRPAPADSSIPKDGGAFDAITATLADAAEATAKPPARAGTPHPLDVGGADPTYAPLPPAFTTDAAKSEAHNPHSQLLDYRDASADVSWGQESARAEPKSQAAGDIVSRGTLIYVYLLTTVDTGNPAAVIQFGVARSVIFRGRCQLPFGTHFLGQLLGRPVRDRLNLKADTLLFPDGLELPASASAVEADEGGSHVRPGVAAYYFPPPPWVQVAPYASDVFTGFMGLLESRAQSQYAVSIGGVGVQSSSSANPAAPLYQASAQAIQDFTQGRLKEIEERYARYYLIPAGTACWLQLDADLNLKPNRDRGQHGLVRDSNLPLSDTGNPHASDVSP